MSLCKGGVLVPRPADEMVDHGGEQPDDVDPAHTVHPPDGEKHSVGCDHRTGAPEVVMLAVDQAEEGVVRLAIAAELARQQGSGEDVAEGGLDKRQVNLHLLEERPVLLLRPDVGLMHVKDPFGNRLGRHGWEGSVEYLG